MSKWNFEEKLALATAMAMDKRLTPAACRVGMVMLLYFQNTASGDTFPSRPQICEATGLSKRMVLYSTQRLRSLGYLTYAESNGGRNKRNSYSFKKRCTKSTGLDEKRCTDSTAPGATIAPARVHKQHRAITPSNLPLEGEASPSPLNEASASPKKENGQQGTGEDREINPETRS